MRRSLSTVTPPMRDASPPLSPEELDRWLAEADIRVEARDVARLHVRLNAVRDRVRVASPQARSVVLHGYVRDLSKAPSAGGSRSVARGFQSGSARGEGWRSRFVAFPIRGIAAWAVVTVLAVVLARTEPTNAFSLVVAVAIPVPGFFIPCLGVVAGAVHAGVECGRARVRSGRARALLGSVVAVALSMTFLYIVLAARHCSDPGLSFMGAVAVGMGGLAGIAGAERGRHDWKVVPEALTLSVPFGYLYAVSALMGCSR